MRVLITGGSGFIGVNAVESFLQRGFEVLNFDLVPFLNPALTSRALYCEGDILDEDRVSQVFGDFQPEYVLHLAGRAECDENTTVAEGYQANTRGTQNVLTAIRATPSVKRSIITSSQYVCRPGYLPKADNDYHPETIYGQSKAITEDLTRAANLPGCWTLIRPTNIWGPWHLRYRRQVWRTLQKGIYLHPGRQPVIRTYGYVGNVVHQMVQIFSLPVEQVHGKTLYVGDAPINLLEWVNGFSRALRGSGVKVVPRPVLRAVGATGDLITALRGKEFLLTSSRFRSMITEYITPMDETFRVLGPNPISLTGGIEETTRWLKDYAPGDGLRF